MRFFACGGASVSPELIRQANDTFANPCAFRVYGSSEVPLVTLGYPNAEHAELAATTDGQTVDYEIRIAGEDGTELLPGLPGEILARGPAMFMGYTDPLQTKEAITEDGFFRTGDLGFIGADASLTVTGRKKDLINRGGEKISPKEIEDALHLHPGIAEAAVVSMPHPRLGEGICAFIIPRPECQIDLKTVSAHICGLGLARQKCPERIILVSRLPKTPSGKVRKDVLRAEVRAQFPVTA
jgi:acyl-CoA synthetase (AMP-forming)/AMP-acid ligase II